MVDKYTCQLYFAGIVAIYSDKCDYNDTFSIILNTPQPVKNKLVIMVNTFQPSIHKWCTVSQIVQDSNVGGLRSENWKFCSWIRSHNEAVIEF